MWFTKAQFEICNELKAWGLQPRFEPGDIVARGFADLGFEEFQVLPGDRLLSLTAGTTSAIPVEHKHHFFWIPSVDETVTLLEMAGCDECSSVRVERRTWKVRAMRGDVAFESEHRTLHQSLLGILRDVMKNDFSMRDAS